jgi:AcrR family transcriptional regulator
MADPRSDRGAASGGETRERLLEAGLRLFATHGYESVSTRRLTRAADANIAAIAYHFGGKQELYQAVVERLVAETEPLFGPVLAALIEGVRKARGDRRALARIAAAFTRGMLSGFVGDERMRWRAALVTREYAQPSEAFDIFFKGRIEPMHKALTELSAAALERDAGDPETVMRAHAIAGQIIFFFLARVVLWARLDWDSYTPERLSQVMRAVTASVLGSLGLPAVEPREEGP